MNSHRSCVYYDRSRVLNYSSATNDNEQIRIYDLKSILFNDKTKTHMMYFLQQEEQQHTFYLQKRKE
jgi:hypothetical protein